MTEPVGQEKAGDLYRITFLMPSNYTLKSLPEPTDSRIRLNAEPARIVATIRYSGTWSRSRYDERERALRKWIQERALEAVGEPVWARYDPPFITHASDNKAAHAPIADRCPASRPASLRVEVEADPGRQEVPNPDRGCTAEGVMICQRGPTEKSCTDATRPEIDKQPRRTALRRR